jgi:hypothetical protein
MGFMPASGSAVTILPLALDSLMDIHIMDTDMVIRRITDILTMPRTTAIIGHIMDTVMAIDTIHIEVMDIMAGIAADIMDIAVVTMDIAVDIMADITGDIMDATTVRL